jgi:hypothetical protein
MVSYKWADADKDGHPDCDIDHPAAILSELSPTVKAKCASCSAGMSRDSHGNCKYCPIGKFQPNELEAGETSPVECDLCGKGKFSEIVYD